MTTLTFPLKARILRSEITDDLRAIVREPSALFFSVLMPVGIFALFVSLFGHQKADGSASFTGTTMVATFGAYAMIAVMMVNPGVSVASDRDRGWMRAKQVSGVPTGTTLAAKVLAALPYALAELAAMTIVAALTGTLDAPAGRLLAVGGLLLLGSVPFALLGLAVGFLASPNAAAAVLNAIMLPMAVFGGLWMPLGIMPPFIQGLAHYLPTYHLAQLALTPLTGGPAAVHALVLAAMTVVTAGLAAVSYRHSHS
jgi:ABC-2 type transport system permease protein